MNALSPLKFFFILAVLAWPAPAQNWQGIRNSDGNLGIARNRTPIVRVKTDPTFARISMLGWDTEDGSRAGTNLLRSGTGAMLRVLVDGDGLVEAVQSGNAGTLREPARSCAWWDALDCGHKDAYSNALIFRSWRCLADLEAKLNRCQQQARYTQLADHLKSAYFPTLFNPQTGLLAWWKSADGQLHDYASPVVNGLAIEYGLIEPVTGRRILARLRAKMQAVVQRERAARERFYRR